MRSTRGSGEELETPHIAPGDPLERFFKHFGEQEGGHHLKPHVTQAAENATEVSVTLDDGKTVPATIIGTDKRTDLALLKIKQGGSYQHVEFAKTTPRIGDWMIAVNPFGLGGTVTASFRRAGATFAPGPMRMRRKRAYSRA